MWTRNPIFIFFFNFTFNSSEPFVDRIEKFIRYYFFEVLTGKRINLKTKVHPKTDPQDAKYAFGHEARNYDK